jgi:hypothetical protein
MSCETETWEMTTLQNKLTELQKEDTKNPEVKAKKFEIRKLIKILRDFEAMKPDSLTYRKANQKLVDQILESSSDRIYSFSLQAKQKSGHTYKTLNVNSYGCLLFQVLPLDSRIIFFYDLPNGSYKIIHKDNSAITVSNEHTSIVNSIKLDQENQVIEFKSVGSYMKKYIRMLTIL